MRHADRLAAAALIAWFAVAALISLASIADPDLGFHIAWGRILQRQFTEAKHITLGQDPAVTVYAYSYWLYQRVVAALYDQAGPWSLVTLRLLLVMATLGTAVLAARRQGARPVLLALMLAAGVLIAHERFVDRPDVASHLAWVAALWILLFHRRGRGAWALVVVQALWVNIHLYFSLLPILYLAFVTGDLLDSRSSARVGSGGGSAHGGAGGRFEWKRPALILLALFAATCLNPAGPGVWASQLRMMSFTAGRDFAIPIQEMISPYATGRPFFSTWAFRFAMPAGVAMAIAGRRRIGTGALLALLFSAALGALAQRAVSIFGVAAIALLPPALDHVLRTIPARASRPALAGAAGALLALGVAGIIGLLNGHLLLRQDKAFDLPDLGPPRFAALGAARFLHAEDVQGPIFHNPVSAGAILMENGTRLTPFMDARWLAPDRAAALYQRAVAASDADAAALWSQAREEFGFEAVILDSYEMPALLHHFAVDPEWPLVYHDDGAAVFCRKGGSNEAVIRRCEPQVNSAWARPDTLRERALGSEASRFLESRRPSIFSRVRFPWDSFGRANFALQVGSRPQAQTAFNELFEREKGSLHLSRHRTEVLGNVLWCLGESRQWRAKEGLCTALIDSREIDPLRRTGLRIVRAEAQARQGRPEEAEQGIRSIAGDPGVAPQTRVSAWSTIALARESSGDHQGAVEACRAALQVLPDFVEIRYTLARILEERLRLDEEALREYRTYQATGGRNDVRPAIARLEAR